MRTEEEILKDFEKLGYKIIKNSDKWLRLHCDLLSNTILISKEDQSYATDHPTDMQEHTLLTELFQIWNWL